MMSGLEISENTALVSLDGLNSLRYIGLDFWFLKNHRVKNFIGPDSLECINRLFAPQLNDSLEAFIGMESLEQVGSLIVFKNPLLPSFVGLSNLNNINGEFKVSNNATLSSFSGLSSLEIIHEGLEVEYNDMLLSLAGLEALQKVEGFHLAIYGNDNLSDLSAIEDLTIKTSELHIYDNNNLSACAINSICESLYNTLVLIKDNAPGCNSFHEIDSICTQIGITEFEDNGSLLFVYPNPTTTSLYIKAYQKIDTYKIYNIAGQFIAGGESDSGIPIANLKPGLYILSVDMDGIFVNLKFIKKD